MNFTALAKKTICILCACFTIISCNNKPNKETILNNEIEQILAQYNAVGATVVAVKDSNIIYNQSFGYKDLENKTPLKNGDIFRIASISKSFTATAVMQMVEQGKIMLEGDVSNYVGFPVRNPKYPNIPITIRMLLSHTSSLNDSEGYFTLNTINPDSSKTYAGAYNDYEPGTKYEYCNLGFNTLGTILERVSGERFDDYIAKNILNPMGLYASFNVNQLDTTMFVNLYEFQKDTTYKVQPSAYANRKEQIANYKFGESTPIFSPTGGMKISAQDLAKVMQMHMNLGKYDTIQIISEHSSSLMQTKMANPTDEGDSYGFAIRISNQLIPGQTMIGHTGSAYGVYTSMFWDSERKFGIITMTNGCNPLRKNNFVALSYDLTNAVYNTLIK